MKVAIQGIKGSYHHQVAVEFFSDDIEIDECMSFDALIESLIEDKSDFGVMAIENSIAGSIIPNYSLIDKYGLSIIGEHYININHNLMVYPGVKFNDVKYISSHPMALLQCKDFIKNSKNQYIPLISEFEINGNIIIWINRNLSLVDLPEWKIIEEFISNGYFKKYPCIPYLSEYSSSENGLITMRLDCDEDIELSLIHI